MNKLLIGGLVLLLVVLGVLASFGSFKTTEVNNSQQLLTNTTDIPAVINSVNAYSLSQVGAHNTISDCWVAYKGNVYDITQFINVHKAPLGGFCGESQKFESAYLTSKHGDSKDSVLDGFKIGSLA